MLLVERGIEVHSTGDSDRVVPLVAAAEPDVVVLDVHMPEPDGFEICRELLERFHPPPAILLLSSDHSATRVIEGIDAGAIDYVAKHDDVRCLIAKIEGAARVADRMRNLAQSALRDHLTGLGNRSDLRTRGSSMMSVARRHQRALSCLVLDIDHFKEVNDTHGHGVGDAVLREVARRLRQTCRAGDALFRVGGEEFVVLTPETDVAAAAQLAERLRRAIAGRVFESGEDADLRLTVSIGVAGWRPGQSLDALIETADAALYEGKRSGRDRVVVRKSLAIERGGDQVAGSS